jgi:hypothetical protein
MSTDHQPLSIAAEVALLFLSELEPKIVDDPELLVSTEAILSFATIRRALPAQWERWKAILANYQKSDLIEYMLASRFRLTEATGKPKRRSSSRCV